MKSFFDCKARMIDLVKNKIRVYYPEDCFEGTTTDNHRVLLAIGHLPGERISFYAAVLRFFGCGLEKYGFYNVVRVLGSCGLIEKNGLEYSLTSAGEALLDGADILQEGLPAPEETP